MADTAPNETPEPALVDDDGRAAAADGKAGVQSLKDNVIKFANDAGDRATAAAEDGKTRAGGALDELAAMLHDAAGTVEEKVGDQYGQYARSAADAVANFSKSFQSKQVDDIIDEARDFVKKSPAVAIGTAAAIGFVLARLVKAGLDDTPRGGTRA